MNKVYEFNGKKYRLKELTLDLMHKASPLLIKYREMHYKYTCNIDTTKLDAAEFELGQLKQAIADLKEGPIPDLKQINNLELKLIEAEGVLKCPKLMAVRKYLNDTEALALYQILTDAKFISGILNSILLLCDGMRSPEIKPMELQVKDSIRFIKDVIADFFLLTTVNS
ncbi:MAG: hypothetical protein ABI543_13185 [Ignavibacteria bacterium]